MPRKKKEKRTPKDTSRRITATNLATKAERKRKANAREK